MTRLLTLTEADDYAESLADESQATLLEALVRKMRPGTVRMVLDRNGWMAESDEWEFDL